MKFFTPFLFVISLSTFNVFADTKIELNSDPGDYIGQGQTYTYDESNSYISFSKNYDNGITMRISNLPDEPYLNWSMNIAAPNDATITTGEYILAERFPFQNSENPGLSFSGQGRGCNTLTGKYEIYDVVYDNDVLTALSMSFEQHCEGGAPALKGKIAFNVIPPVGASAIGIETKQVLCRNKTTGQTVKTKTASSFIDCKKLGLKVTQGDKIVVRIVGNAID